MSFALLFFHTEFRGYAAIFLVIYLVNIYLVYIFSISLLLYQFSYHMVRFSHHTVRFSYQSGAVFVPNLNDFWCNEWYDFRTNERYNFWRNERYENRPIQTNLVEIGVKVSPLSSSVKYPLFINSFLASNTLVLLIPILSFKAAGEKSTQP